MKSHQTFAVLLIAMMVLTITVPEASGACQCTYQYEPICGSDGNTYGNECQLKCEKEKNSALTIAKKGQC